MFYNEDYSHRSIQALTGHCGIWEWLLTRKDFTKAISSEGFFEFEKSKIIEQFIDWKNAIYANHRIKWRIGEFAPPSNASLNVSECMSKTPDVLKDRDLYLMNSGRNWGIVFDSHRFFPPYLSLGSTAWSAKRLPVDIGSGHDRLIHAFRSQWNEATFIKALHFCGAFSALIKNLCGARQYFSGPSGILPSKFPFWMIKRKRSGKKAIAGFVYDGVVDLDECIYPKDRSGIVIPIEAKINHIPDIGWHKLAFPSYRFVEQKGNNSFQYRTECRSGVDPDSPDSTMHEKRIIPVYCAADPFLKSAFVYVFRELKARKGPLGHGPNGASGFVINDPLQLTPKSVYKVDLSWIYGE